ncbi:hypothetical protein H0H92_000136 [Tricholoma furcatifolium]|nr:hypothetical protein H0H92_000136 [Tricholoma furcatifolium]
MYRLNPAPVYYGQPPRPGIPPPFPPSNAGIPPYPGQGGPSPMYYDNSLTSQTPPISYSDNCGTVSPIDHGELSILHLALNIGSYIKFQNQNVKVLIEARGWVVGIIVGVLKAVDKVTHWGYTVQYKTGQTTMQRDFSAKDVMPIDG